MSGSFATLLVGTIVLDGIGRQLDPELSLLEASIPFLFKNASHLTFQQQTPTK
jgi:predicted unusual protein kinase regulating ubiquinone biosynthesis (AarF/ABC1/UbiB family)